MYLAVTKGSFVTEFEEMNRVDNFTKEGLAVLFEYLEGV